MSLANKVAHYRECGFAPLTLGVRSHHICEREGPSDAAPNTIVRHECTEIAWGSSCRVGQRIEPTRSPSRSPDDDGVVAARVRPAPQSGMRH